MTPTHIGRARPSSQAICRCSSAYRRPYRSRRYSLKCSALRIIAALATGGRNYISQLARDLGISRPLLHLHLQKLESAGLVSSQLELSPDGKALNFFEASTFDLRLTPASIAAAASSLTPNPE